MQLVSLRPPHRHHVSRVDAAAFLRPSRSSAQCVRPTRKYLQFSQIDALIAIKEAIKAKTFQSRTLISAAFPDSSALVDGASYPQRGWQR